MNPLVILPLLAAACLAAPAPGNIIQQGGLVGLGAVGVTNLVQPQLTQLTYSAPAVAQVQVQVPVTKTVHYETKPVVTGYSTSIIKPAIASGVVAAPALAIPQQQVVVQGIDYRQLPPLPNFPALPTPQPNGTADAPAFPAFPEFPQFPTPNPNNTADAPQAPTPPTIPGIPAFPALPTQGPVTTTPAPPAEGGNNGEGQQLVYTLPGNSQQFYPNVFNPLNFVSVEQRQIVQAPAQVAVQAPAQDAVVVEARSAAPVAVAQAPVAIAQPQITYSAAPVVQQQQVVQVRAAQAGDFEPLVTKEQVLAPVRTHTQITPQVTQVQPEVTVRRVVQEVNVAQPVAVQTPVTYAVNSPIVAGAQVFNGQVLNGQVLNGQLLNGQVLNGQLLNGQLLNGQVLNGQVFSGL